ncbi:MAG: hypothetical protein CSA45_01100 [Gammaproteobacteria bacterium]|nr:MAG: hypothetical protein CSA45_01100 [Gammaproteobacteria bacterium]
MIFIFNIRSISVSAFLILSSCLFSVQAKTTPERAVAILYDDSGSMGQPKKPNSNTRSVNANIALQTLLSLMQSGDEVYINRMSDAKNNKFNQPVTFMTSEKNIDDIVNVIRKKYLPPTSTFGTYFASIIPLLKKLAVSEAKNKWFIVITDAAENIDVDKDSDNRKKAANYFNKLTSNIHFRFVLIEPVTETKNDKIKWDDVSQVAGYWKANTKAIFDPVFDAEELPSVLEGLASELVGRDKKGLHFKQSNETLSIQSELPLKGIVVLIQNVKENLTIDSSQLGADKIPQSRFHIIRPPDNRKGIDDISYVAHITTNKTIQNQDKTAKITFNRPLNKQAKIKVFPTPATKIKTEVYSQGKQVFPKGGAYQVCEPNGMEVRTILVDEDGNHIPTKKMLVRLKMSNGKTLKPEKKRGYYYTTFSSDEIKNEIKITTFAQYPNYFDIEDAPITIKSKPCFRNIALRVVSGADGSDWRHDVDKLNKADPIVLEVLVKGKKAIEDQMKDFDFNTANLPDNLPWDIEKEEETGHLILSPKSECCAFFWTRPNITPKTSLTLTRENISSSANDKMKNVNLTFEITRPQDDYRYYWWQYGCPIVFWISIFLLAWYLWRIFVTKERFAYRSEIHIKRSDEEYSDSEPLVMNRFSLKRMLWPSKNEVKVIEGIVFVASGHGGSKIKISGKCLNKDFRVSGSATWKFNSNRYESGQIQQDAILFPRATTLKHYDENGDADYYMQYTTNHTDPVWD